MTFDDKNDKCSSGLSISRFDIIVDRNSGTTKSLLARGAFGDVYLALDHLPTHKVNPHLFHRTNNDLDQSQEKRRDCDFRFVGSPKFAAIKCIRNCLVDKQRNSSYGGMMHSARTQGMEQHLAKEEDSSNEESSESSNSNEAETLPHNDRGRYQLTKATFCELYALRFLSGHPCIITLLDYFHLDDMLALAFPYCPMDMADIIERVRGLKCFRGYIPDRFLRRLWKDVLEGLKYCHGHRVMHRDIKPGNLLISSSGRVQLADFGLAKAFTVAPTSGNLALEADPTGIANEEVAGSVSAYAPMSDGICTLHYRPPELLFGATVYGPGVDIYSCGLVFAETLILNPLFRGRNLFDQIAKTFRILGTPDETNWPDAKNLPDFAKLNFSYQPPISLDRIIPRAAGSLSLFDLLSSMIVLNPRHRASAAKCLEHPWFQELPLAVSSDEIADVVIPDKVREPEILYSSPEDICGDKWYHAKLNGACIATRRRLGHQEDHQKENIEKIEDFNGYFCKKLDSLRTPQPSTSPAS